VIVRWDLITTEVEKNQIGWENNYEWQSRRRRRKSWFI
jgi:hypothetical protein